jgi:hypothetical protein
MEPDIAISTFVRLVKKESYIYYKKSPHGYLDYDDFFEEGMVTLVGCLIEWKKPAWHNKSSHDRKAYFKTSMYNAFKTLLTSAFAKKRVGEYRVVERDGEKFTEYFWHEVKCDDVFPELRCNGFDDVLYKELVFDLETKIVGDLPKKIFLLLVDPPNDLVRMALVENRRKMKRIGPCRGKNSVRLSNRLVIKYLNNGGCISDSDYYNSLKYIRDVVGQCMHIKLSKQGNY